MAARRVGRRESRRRQFRRAAPDPARRRALLPAADAAHLQLDADRSSLRGHAAEVPLVNSGRWLGSPELKQVSAGFEFNGLGFHGRVDSRSVVGLVGRQIEASRGILRS